MLTHRLVMSLKKTPVMLVSKVRKWLIILIYYKNKINGWENEGGYGLDKTYLIHRLRFNEKAINKWEVEDWNPTIPRELGTILERKRERLERERKKKYRERKKGRAHLRIFLNFSLLLAFS